MMPEAFREGGESAVGLITVLGFALAAGLDRDRRRYSRRAGSHIGLEFPTACGALLDRMSGPSLAYRPGRSSCACAWSGQLLGVGSAERALAHRRHSDAGSIFPTPPV